MTSEITVKACPKCKGMGSFPIFGKLRGEICYTCDGSGVVNTSSFIVELPANVVNLDAYRRKKLGKAK